MAVFYVSVGHKEFVRKEFDADSTVTVEHDVRMSLGWDSGEVTEAVEAKELVVLTEERYLSLTPAQLDKARGKY